MDKTIKISLLSAVCMILLSACGSSERQMNAFAPPPPPMAYLGEEANILPQIQPANGVALAASGQSKKKSCSFSSFHRKNTLGYEIDQSRHISFDVRPSFDVFDPSDFDTKLSLRFTKALSGPANKRPKCTFGKGFYGLLPYAQNKGMNLNDMLDGDSIKGFVEEKLQEREDRRRLREARMDI